MQVTSCEWKGTGYKKSNYVRGICVLKSMLHYSQGNCTMFIFYCTNGSSKINFTILSGEDTPPLNSKFSRIFEN